MELLSRNSAIDIAKGIAIISMVIGHSGCPHLIHNFVYSFQVPLFFMASGYCLKEAYINDIGKFAFRKIRTLYLPYIKWGVFFVLAHNLLCSINCYNPMYGFHGTGILPYSQNDSLENVMNTIFFMRNAEPLLGGFWFVRELIIGSFILLGLLRIVNNTYWVFLILFSVAAILLLTKYQTPFLHIGFLSFYAALYILIGYIGKSKYRPMHLKYDLPILCLLAGLFYFFPHPGVIETTKKTYILYFPLSIISTYIIFDLCTKIQNSESKLVTYIKSIGERYTLIILALHFISFKLVSWLIVTMYDINAAHIAEFPIILSYAEKGWWIAYSVVGVSVPLAYGLIHNLIKNMIYRK